MPFRLHILAAMLAALTVATVGCGNQEEQLQRQMEQVRRELAESKRTNEALASRLEKLDGRIFVMGDEVDAHSVHLAARAPMFPALPVFKASPGPPAPAAKSLSRKQGSAGHKRSDLRVPGQEPMTFRTIDSEGRIVGEDGEVVEPRRYTMPPRTVEHPPEPQARDDAAARVADPRDEPVIQMAEVPQLPVVRMDATDGPGAGSASPASAQRAGRGAANVPRPSARREKAEPLPIEMPARVEAKREPLPIETPARVEAKREALPIETPARVEAKREPLPIETPARVEAKTEPLPIETPARVEAKTEPLPIETPARVEAKREPPPIETPARVEAKTEPLPIETPAPPVILAQARPVTAPAPSEPEAPRESPREAEVAPPVPPDSDPVTLYQASMDALRAGRHDSAVAGFRALIERSPRHELADNAMYWLGEADYDRRRFDSALQIFQRVMIEYPLGNKVPDAMLKIALCFQNLGEPRQAREILEQLGAIYPSSDAAHIAQQRLATLAGAQQP